jgi:hypothetical protein
MLLAEVGLEPVAIDSDGPLDLLWWNRILTPEECHQIERAMVLAGGHYAEQQFREHKDVR